MKIKKQPDSPQKRLSRQNGASISSLIEQIRELVQSARKSAVTAVNTLQVHTNFEIGRRIVEHEQQGQHRAEYGKRVLKELAKHLNAEFGRGFSEDNLSHMRKFYSIYQERMPISETASRKLISGKFTLQGRFKTTADGMG